MAKHLVHRTKEAPSLAPLVLPAIGVYQSKPPGALHAILPEKDVKFDKRSPYAIWDSGYLTRLPYIADEIDPGKNLLESVRTGTRTLASY